MKKIRGKDVRCLVVVSQTVIHDGEPVELHAIKTHFKILTEGHRDYFFEVERAVDQQEDPGEELLPGEVRRVLAQRTVDTVDAAELAGIAQIDDEDEPAPQNIVGAGEQDVLTLSSPRNTIKTRGALAKMTGIHARRGHVGIGSYGYGKDSNARR
jgi:hypothetical protein